MDKYQQSGPWLTALLCLLMALPVVGARAATQDLFDAEVTVPNQTSGVRTRATGEALKEVLVRVAGQEVETAPTAAFFARASHPYTGRLLRSLPNPEGTIEDIPGEISGVAAENRHVVIRQAPYLGAADSVVDLILGQAGATP